MRSKAGDYKPLEEVAVRQYDTSLLGDRGTQWQGPKGNEREGLKSAHQAPTDGATQWDSTGLPHKSGVRLDCHRRELDHRFDTVGLGSQREIYNVTVTKETSQAASDFLNQPLHQIPCQLVKRFPDLPSFLQRMLLY